MRQRHAGNSFFFSCLSYSWKAHLGRMIFFFKRPPAMTWGSGTKWKTQNSPAVFFGSCENCWETSRIPCEMHKNNTNNSNVSWKMLENSEKILRLGSSVAISFGWLTCFGLKVHTKNVKCAVTTNSSPIVSSSSSPLKSRVSCILGTWILVAFTKFTNFYEINGVWPSKSLCEVWQNVTTVPKLHWTSDFCN